MLHFHRLKIADVRQETAEAVCVTFEVPKELEKEFRFVQGQHLNVRQQINGEDIRRSYSICSPVSDGLLRVGIKHVPDGLFSSWANGQLKAGDELEVMTPTGSFFTTLDPSHEKTYVAFVAGSGITPVLSIIGTTLETEPNSQFILFYGNKSRLSIMFLEALEDLKNRYLGRFSLHHILSREPQDAAIYHGRIDGDRALALCRAFAPVDQVDEFFVCGPSSMIDQVNGMLVTEGVASEHIHFERFGIAKENLLNVRQAKPKKTSADACKVTVTLDGHQRHYDMPMSGESVLEAGARAGLDLPFSCKGGVCGTCRTKVVSGEVDVAVDYALEPWEREAGFVLACQATPLTDALVIDYDEV